LKPEIKIDPAEANILLAYKGHTEQALKNKHTTNPTAGLVGMFPST